jgi:hypothetical protein
MSIAKTFPRARLAMRMQAVAAALLLTTGLAHADRPANLAGTTWTTQIDRDSAQIVILTQSGPGIPGGPTCVTLRGTIGIAPVRGWYCPEQGDIFLIHENLSSGRAMRVFTGHVSTEVTGQPLYMAGTVYVANSAFGKLGQYNFSAVN